MTNEFYYGIILVNQIHNTKHMEGYIMTNAMIIFMERCRLMDEGKLKGTGRFVEIETDQGVQKMEEPEQIHTYAKWKELGYQVRKGEKSDIKITVWKYRGRVQHDEESGEDIETGRCFMKTAAFFTAAQVDRIPA